MLDSTSTRRARELTTKILSSPTLPLLGWTKAVETVVAGGPTANWIGYATLVTAIWVFADDVREAADDIQDTAQTLTED